MRSLKGRIGLIIGCTENPPENAIFPPAEPPISAVASAYTEISSFPYTVSQRPENDAGAHPLDHAAPAPILALSLVLRHSPPHPSNSSGRVSPWARKHISNSGKRVGEPEAVWDYSVCKSRHARGAFEPIVAR